MRALFMNDLYKLRFTMYEPPDNMYELKPGVVKKSKSINRRERKGKMRFKAPDP